ncbi:glycoside hydrolase superfamily [Rhizoctonia solani]|nr:glycoside hydrolase superfamily [Rhizoctonia solani]
MRLHLGRVLVGVCTLCPLGVISKNIQQEYEYRSVQIPVSQLYDNVATEDFDGNGAGYAAELLPIDELKNENIRFALPKWGSGRPDNFISNKQEISVHAGYIREFHILYAGDWIDGENGAEFEFEFQDGKKQVVQLSVKNWWDLHWLNNGAIQTTYHNTPNGRNYNVTQMHHWSSTVFSSSPLKSIRFPPASDINRLHVFALSLVPAYAPNNDLDTSPPAISVKNVRLTTLKTERGDSIVEVTLANLRGLVTSDYAFASSGHGSAAHLHGHRPPRRPYPDGDHQIVLGNKPEIQDHGHEHYTSSILTGPHEVIVRPVDGQIGVRTVTPGKIFRLMPGDDARVDIAVNFDSTSQGIFHSAVNTLETIGASLGLPAAILRWISFSSLSSEVEVIVLSLDTSSPIARSTGWELDLGNAGILKENVEFWEPTVASLSRHETPRWWNNAKFGIFIHWGIYSVPGWVPKGYYEEWYNWWLHNPAQPSNILWNYHRETFGEDKLYDDFIPEFNGAKFNASQWINLFATAGAKYFVLVTKHHDGFALFDTHNSTHRSSVHLGPKRDFIRELMETASKEHPTIHRGTYYSMPEWFNPDAGPYGFGNWPGHLATGAYNHSLLEPYTGRLEGKDYLRDIQLEHMRILADEYGTEIMWCDIGGPNRTLEFAAEWYNRAAKAGKQVTINNRCGLVPDFDTPEYARFSSIQTHSWETSEGIDPYSYAYNRQTKDEEYRSAETIIQTLVDIVSKNGNYLLNLGPTGEGEIIPAMVERLVEVGAWLDHSGECVFNTTYTFLGAESGSFRFTTTPKSFCMITFSEPKEGLLVVDRPVPILPGDTVTFLGDKKAESLPWSYHNGKLAVVIPKEPVKAVKHAWAFKVTYADTK